MKLWRALKPQLVEPKRKKRSAEHIANNHNSHAAKRPKKDETSPPRTSNDGDDSTPSKQLDNDQDEEERKKQLRLKRRRERRLERLREKAEAEKRAQELGSTDSQPQTTPVESTPKITTPRTDNDGDDSTPKVKKVKKVTTPRTSASVADAAELERLQERKEKRRLAKLRREAAAAAAAAAEQPSDVAVDTTAQTKKRKRDDDGTPKVAKKRKTKAIDAASTTPSTTPTPAALHSGPDAFSWQATATTATLASFTTKKNTPSPSPSPSPSTTTTQSSGASDSLLVKFSTKPPLLKGVVASSGGDQEPVVAPTSPRAAEADGPGSKEKKIRTKPNTYLPGVKQLLEQRGSPMHISEILTNGIEQGLFVPTASYSMQKRTLRKIVEQDIARGESFLVQTQVAPIFALREWRLPAVEVQATSTTSTSTTSTSTSTGTTGDDK
jgi:hypothetical protein